MKCVGPHTAAGSTLICYLCCAMSQLRGNLISFLAGLAVAGAYAGFRLRDDLGNFATAINKLQNSVDDGA